MPDTAKDKLKKMTAWDIGPELSDGEIDELLIETSLTDAAGLPPDDDDWAPTYDLNAAASKGWMIKAARAAALVEIDPPGSGVFTSKVFDNCARMARTYASRCAAVVECPCE